VDTEAEIEGLEEVARAKGMDCLNQPGPRLLQVRPQDLSRRRGSRLVTISSASGFHVVDLSALTTDESTRK
jgi:hypothetical protein